jgi:hypothetical protein
MGVRGGRVFNEIVLKSKTPQGKKKKNQITFESKKHIIINKQFHKEF